MKKDIKKLLIITYYWPPAGGPGVQRWLKFVKYLPDFDIQPIVYIPENPTYPIVDAHLEKEVSQQAIVLRKSITGSASPNFLPAATSYPCTILSSVASVFVSTKFISGKIIFLSLILVLAFHQYHHQN